MTSGDSTSDTFSITTLASHPSDEVIVKIIALKLKHTSSEGCPDLGEKADIIRRFLLGPYFVV